MGKYSSIFTMIIQRICHCSAKSTTVSTEGNFSRTSGILGSHESLSIVVCDDIAGLVTYNIEEGLMHTKLVASLRVSTERDYLRKTIQEYYQDATYVSLGDIIVLQKNSAKCGHMFVVY